MSRSTDNLSEQSAVAPLPRWFRRGLIVVTTLMLCSCRASDQAAYGQSNWQSAICETCEADGSTGDGATGNRSAAQSGCLTCQPGSQAGCQNGCQQGCLPGRLIGPKDEYLCDGDDSGYEAGIEKDGTLVGLGQEDTIAHYETIDGRLLVVPSSRVCIYAPRFGAVRQVVHPMGAQQRLFVAGVGDTLSLAEADERQLASSSLQNLSVHERATEIPTSVYRGRQQAGEGYLRQAVIITKGMVGPLGTQQIVHVGEYVNREKAVIADHSLAAITWTGDQAVQVTLSGQGASAVFDVKEPGIIYQTEEPNRPKLRLVKLASTDAAHPGDEVEFTLRYDNVGDVPIRGVTLIDNLTTRLAYVEGSAESSRDAEFATANNDAGSLVLRWQLDEELPPGEGGVVHFKTRVR